MVYSTMQYIVLRFKIILQLESLRPVWEPEAFWLSHEDSNFDRQNQNLQCYHYTMRQSCLAF